MRCLKFLYVICCFQFIGIKLSHAQKIVRAADYGVYSNNSGNAVGIRKAIEVCKRKPGSVLLLPGGQIDIWPENSPKRELFISNCTEDDTLSKVKNNAFHTVVFDPVREMLHYGSFQPFLLSKAIEEKPLNVRFEGDFKNSSLHAGDVLTIRNPYRDNCGAFIHLSKDIRLENVKMYFMHGLGIVSQFSQNISLHKVSVAPKQGSGRVIASFADCFHFSGCRGLIKIDNCFTSGAHDDAINVHGTHLQIVSTDERKIRIRFMHPQNYGFKACFSGDSIAFVNPKTLMPLGYAKLTKANLINHREMEII